jgi:putative component of membrane protein insertase Oxa1/YidC/SpoIIIJ protein YidD
MNPRLQDLHDRIRHIEEEIEQELRHRRAELHADFEHRRVAFEQEVLTQQRRFRQGVLRYLADSQWRNAITAPLIYPVLLPLLLVDLAVTLYQWLCFPLYRVARVRRRDYLAFDRTHLGYLNAIEKLNCAYCSYANGLAAYVAEVIARTEQFWCPIKHARRVLRAHPYYAGFVDYGDAQGYRLGLQALRESLARLDDEAAQAPT